MIQEHFLSLDRNDKCPYEILDTAQIEPTSPTDPDELYRMKKYSPSGRGEEFDAVFYPDRVEIQDTEMGVRIWEVPDDGTVDSPQELYKELETALS